MSNVASNPFSFASTDVNSFTVSTISQHAENSQIINVTTSTVHGLVLNQFFTLIGVNPAGFIGFYKAIVLPTTSIVTGLRIPGQPLAAGLTYSSGGNLLYNQFAGSVRAEDMSWQNAAAAGDEIQVYDRNGKPVWDTVAPTQGNYSRGKPYWISGISLAKLSSGVLFVTIN